MRSAEMQWSREDGNPARSLHPARKFARTTSGYARCIPVRRRVTRMLRTFAYASSASLTRRERAVACALSLGLCLVVGFGCARRAAPPPIPAVLVDAGPYQARPGDVIDIKFLYHPNESQK